MNHDPAVSHILSLARRRSYFVPTDRVPPDQREACDRISKASEAIRNADDAACARALVATLRRTGHIDEIRRYSGLCVIEAHPHVRRFELADSYATEMEVRVNKLGGPRLTIDLAAVARHRGVTAFVRGFNEPAMRYFEMAVSYDLTAENVSNVMCVLTRCGRGAVAADLLSELERVLPGKEGGDDVLAELRRRVESDLDLAELGKEVLISN